MGGKKDILGFMSAAVEAEEMKGKNMEISANLILEVWEYVSDLEQRLRWIPVEEEHPPNYLPCLVAVCAPLSYNQVNMGAIDEAGDWRVLDADGNHADFITHWMPLPIPPNDIKERE